MDEAKAAIPKLTEALIKVQATMTPVKKDSVNPHFKNTYADLSSIIEAARKPLTDNGLAFVQLLSGAPNGVTVLTRLLHTSGESIESSCWMPVTQSTPQGFGSAATYCKRYALAAMLGIATEDDDGNASSGAGKGQQMPPPAGIDQLRQQVARPSPAAAPPPSDPEAAHYAELERESSVSATKRTHEDLVMGNFGSGKGKRMSELDDNSVAFYRSACQKTLADSTKSQFHAREILRLAAFNAELRFRGLPT